MIRCFLEGMKRDGGEIAGRREVVERTETEVLRHDRRPTDEVEIEDCVGKMRLGKVTGSRREH